MRVHVDLDRTGVLRKLSAEGHAGFALKGQDIVCAAASMLLLTVARTFEAAQGITVEGGTGDRGNLDLLIVTVAPERAEWSRGVTAVFLQGIRDLAAEYPDRLSLSVTEI